MNAVAHRRPPLQYDHVWAAFRPPAVNTDHSQMSAIRRGKVPDASPMLVLVREDGSRTVGRLKPGSQYASLFHALRLRQPWKLGLALSTAAIGKVTSVP